MQPMARRPRSFIMLLSTSVALLAGACSGRGATIAAPTTSNASATNSTTGSSTSANDPISESAPTTGSSDCSVSAPFDAELRVDSAVYGSSERVRVHITPCVEGSATPLPILYLLHGANADETQWVAIGGLDEADNAVRDGILPPSIIVIPDAAPAYACQGCSGPLTDHLLDEIEPLVNAIHPVDTTRRAIGGISRGGGLALEVAGFNTADFVAVGGHSAVPADLAAIANLAAAQVPVYLDAGSDDGLAGAARDMATGLLDQGGDVKLVISDGRHDRPYWSSKVLDYFGFYGVHLTPR